MSITNASGAGPQMTADEAEALMSARERMLARHKLIEAMIRNNELQLEERERPRRGRDRARMCASRRGRGGRGRGDARRRRPSRRADQNSRGRTTPPRKRARMAQCFAARIRERSIGSATDGTCLMSATETMGVVEPDPAAPSQALTEEDRSKDDFFVRLAQLAEAMIARHGKEFAMGTLVLSARFIAEGKSLIQRNGPNRQ